jgi:hypothetical protein
VNKTKISRVPLIVSSCCDAPSTSQSRVSSGDGDERSSRVPKRRCVRCRQVFCLIDVDERREPPLKAVVGARTE